LWAIISILIFKAMFSIAKGKLLSKYSHPKDPISSASTAAKINRWFKDLFLK
jgi:hypothetical protein